MPLIAVDGLDLAYDLTGPSGAPVVAFSNSLGTTRAMWDGVAARLRGRYRILRYDTRGHGGSATRDAPAEIADFARDLLGLLDALAIERAHLVGLSLGGMTVQALAARAPERVLSLTLMATTAHMPSEASWNERAALVRAQGTAAIVEATLGRWFTPGFAERAPEVVGPIRDAFAACDGAGYAVACGAIGRMDLRPILSRITAPTLVVAGRDDPATPPAMAEALCAGIPQAELVLLPRAAHLLAVEHPDAAAAHLLGFLDRHRPPAAATGAVPFPVGLANREAVLGPEHVARALSGAGGFAGPWQECGARIHKLRVYETMTEPTGREVCAYLLVRGSLHAHAYALALKKLTGVAIEQMLPTPNIDLSRIPECQKYLDEGKHRRLYTFSEEDYKEAAGVWSNDEVALPGDPPGNLEVVDGYPEGGKIPELDGNYGAFAPDYAPEEIFEIASKLYKKGR